MTGRSTEGPQDVVRGGGDVVRLSAGAGGLPRVEVRSSCASAEVYLHGARVTGWVPAGSEPVLWTAALGTTATEAPLRGGIVLHAPGLDADPADDGPLPGRLCRIPWTFAGWTWHLDDVVLVFTVGSEDLRPAARQLGLRYRVTVGRALTTELEVTNTGTDPLRFEESVSTHLAVTDVRDVLLAGFGDLDRLDRLTGRRARTPVDAHLRVVGATDHLYRRPGAVSVVDYGAQRCLRVSTRGSAGAGVSHPWSGPAAGEAGPDDEAWSTMLCLASENVGEDAVVLAPGRRHSLVTVLAVGPIT